MLRAQNKRVVVLAVLFQQKVNECCSIRKIPHGLPQEVNRGEGKG